MQVLKVLLCGCTIFKLSLLFNSSTLTQLCVFNYMPRIFQVHFLFTRKINIIPGKRYPNWLPWLELSMWSLWFRLFLTSVSTWIFVYWRWQSFPSQRASFKDNRYRIVLSVTYSSRHNRVRVGWSGRQGSVDHCWHFLRFGKSYSDDENLRMCNWRSAIWGIVGTTDTPTKRQLQKLDLGLICELVRAGISKITIEAEFGASDWEQKRDYFQLMEVICLDCLIEYLCN